MQTRSFVMWMIRSKVFLGYYILYGIGKHEITSDCENHKTSSQNLVYHPLPVNDPLQRQPDTTKAKELLG
jgi:hypothetical protein